MAIIKKFWWALVIALQIQWWKNYPLKLTEYTTELEITTDEQTEASNDSLMFQYLFAQEAAARFYLTELMTYRLSVINGTEQTLVGVPPVMVVITPPTEVLGGMMNRTFNKVKNLRSRDGFTSTIATGLKIVGVDYPSFDPSTFVAKGTGKTTYDGNLIGFTKGPYLDGVGIWMQRGSDPLFYLIDKITTGKFLDSQLNLAAGPETRQYYVRGFINNVYVGSPCAPFSLTWTSAPPTTVAAAPGGVGMPAPVVAVAAAAKAIDTNTPPEAV